MSWCRARLSESPSEIPQGPVRVVFLQAQQNSGAPAELSCARGLFFYTHSNTLQLQQPKRQQRTVWTSCFCESIQAPLQNSSRSVNSCGMGTSGQADRRSCQSLGAAVQWFRVWLWVLLWAVLTSGVEPSQRAVGGTAPGVDLQVQSFVLSLLVLAVSAECTSSAGWSTRKQRGCISSPRPALQNTAVVVPCPEQTERHVTQ